MKRGSSYRARDDAGKLRDYAGLECGQCKFVCPDPDCLLDTPEDRVPASLRQRCAAMMRLAELRRLSWPPRDPLRLHALYGF
jgi:hypothetical protein